jgi:hypothetical protein
MSYTAAQLVSQNPNYNISLTDAQAVFTAMQKLGLGVDRIFGQDHPGRDSAVEVSVQEIVDSGLAETPIELYFGVASSTDGLMVALVKRALYGGGKVPTRAGFLNVWADINQNKSLAEANAALLNVPGVIEQVDRIIAAAGAAPKAAAKPAPASEPAA